jgi:hypothetical protein
VGQTDESRVSQTDLISRCAVREDAGGVPDASPHAGIVIAISRSHGIGCFPSPTRPGAHITKLNCPHDRVLDKLNPCLGCGKPHSAHRGGKCPASASVRAVRSSSHLRHADGRGGNRFGGPERFTIRYVHPTQAHQDKAMEIYDRLNEDRQTPGAAQ